MDCGVFRAIRVYYIIFAWKATDSCFQCCLLMVMTHKKHLCTFYPKVSSLLKDGSLMVIIKHPAKLFQLKSPGWFEIKKGLPRKLNLENHVHGSNIGCWKKEELWAQSAKASECKACLYIHLTLVLKALLCNLGCSMWFYLHFLTNLIIVIKKKLDIVFFVNYKNTVFKNIEP